jgi:hypothetical protein
MALILKEKKLNGTELVISVPSTNATLDENPPRVWRVAWRHTAEIRANQGQTIFPSAPIGAMFDITIEGTMQYRWKSSYTSKPRTVSGRADALFCTTPYRSYNPEDTGKFDQPHEWFRIYDKPVKTHYLVDKNGRRDRFGLQADREAHCYRIRQPRGGEDLVIACEAEEGDAGTFTTWGSFRASVTAWILEKESEIFPAPKTEPAQQPAPAPPSPEEILEEQLRGDDIRARDFQRRLIEIARREQKALAEIDSLAISEESKQLYRDQAADFAAGEVERLLGNKHNSKTVETI